MKKSTVFRIVLVLVAVAGIAAAAWRLNSNQSAELDAALIVKVTQKDLLLEVTETGKIAAREKVDIKSKVAGQVAAVLVDEGQAVKQGQLLLRIDPTDIAREVARAEAELAREREALAFAEQVAGRKAAALKERATSEADVEQAQSEVAARKATIRVAEVALAAAMDRLRACEIRAPMNGTVTERGIEAGEVVTPGVQATFDGKALLTISDLSTLLVRVELNQIDVAKVAVDQPATLTLDALPGASFAAAVTKVAPAAVKASNRESVEVFPVEATLRTDAPPAALDGGPVPAADEATRIKPGMTADVKILVGTLPHVLVLPLEAVVKKDGKSLVKRVLVVDGKKSTEDVEVKTGKSNDREVELLDTGAAGLKLGDEVLIDPGSSKANEAKM